MYKYLLSKNTIEIRNITTDVLIDKICNVFAINSNSNGNVKVHFGSNYFNLDYTFVTKIFVNKVEVTKPSFNDFVNILANIVVLPIDITSSGTTVPTTPTVPINQYPNMYTPFTNLVNFTGFPLVMEQKQITAPLTITPVVTGAIPGATVVIRLVADGVQANTPIFANAKQITGSSGWDNTAGIVNIVTMQFDGVEYLFNIVQTAIGVVLDLQEPTLLSSAINAAGTIVTLTFNEDLLATSVPTASNFTGATLASASIAGKVVTLNISPAVAVGTRNIVYSGTAIKDLSGNASLGFTTAVTVAPSQVIAPVNLASRAAGINELSVGTYVVSSSNGWMPAITTSAIFVGDKTFEMTASSGTFGQGIIGLDATAISAATLGDWPNLDLGIAWYGGRYAAMQQGQGQVSLINYQGGDLVRLKRDISGLIVAEMKRGSADWVNLFKFPGLNNAPLAPVFYLNDVTSQTSVVIY